MRLEVEANCVEPRETLFRSDKGAGKGAERANGAAGKNERQHSQQIAQYDHGEVRIEKPVANHCHSLLPMPFCHLRVSFEQRDY